MSAPTKTKSKTRKIGNYEIIRELAQGGMGVVHLALQPRLDRLVVLKKIRAPLARDKSSSLRFEREARTAAALHHQNVVAVYDSFSVRGEEYIAQEYVDGASLREILDRLHHLPPRIAGLITLAVTRGLEEIHALGIVHRDIKPGNVLIGASGETKIADFGIAWDQTDDGLTLPGMLLGSPPYMSPEQMIGDGVDYRSDLFSLGCLLYEMVAGEPPYRARGDGEENSLLRRIRRERYTTPRRMAPRVPRGLSRLISRCLKAKPSRRIASATALRRALERQLGFVSPTDCRREIADHLWQAGALEARDDRTVRRVAPQPKRWPHRLHRVRAAGFVLLLLAAFPFGWQVWRTAPLVIGVARLTQSARVSFTAPPGSMLPQVEAESAPRSMIAPPREGWLHLEVHPWAEVSIDGGPTLCTPHPAPLALAPGPHHFVVEHPHYGRAEYDLQISGEQIQELRHVWSRAYPGGR